MEDYKQLYWILLLGLLVAFGTRAVAQSPDPLVLSDDQGNYPLGLHLEILEDKTKTWTIEDVTSPEIAQDFVPSRVTIPNFGFTDSAYWIRFSVSNEADPSTRWLLMVDANLFYIDVYKPAPTPSGYEVARTGAALPYNTRELPHPKYIFSLPLSPSEEQAIFLRVESESSLSAPLTIWSATALAQKDLLDQVLNGFLLGVVLIMGGYNLILFFYLKDNSYLYYTLFLISLLMALLVDNNIAHQYLWPSQGRFNAIAGQFFFVLMVIFVLKFAVSFLVIREHLPKLNRVFNILMIAAALIIPLEFINIGIAARPLLIISVSSFTLIITSAVITWRKGYRPARYFLLAWVLLLTSLLVFVLSLFGLLPFRLISIVGTEVGIVVLTLTLSLALADRINTFREEKEAAQLELLHQQRETIRLKEEFNVALQEMNVSLKERYTTHTQEMKFAQEQLETLFEHSPLGIGTASMDGDILTANDALAHIFGYANEELTEVNVMDFFPDKKEREMIMNRLLKENTIQVPRLQLQRKDGSLFYANLTESILTRGGKDVLLGVVDDITSQVLAEETLKEKDRTAAIVAERERLARELHDSVTQSLYTSSLIAEALPKVWDSHPEEALQSLDELRQLNLGALAEMRTLLLELRPEVLADRPLGELLIQLAKAMSSRTNLPITTSTMGDCQLQPQVQIALYRIAQEGLNNLSKHAQATRAWVSLRCSSESVRLRISDNGRGFDPEKSEPHQLGLNIMRERAEEIGASLSITSEPGQGSQILVEWESAGAED